MNAVAAAEALRWAPPPGGARAPAAEAGSRRRGLAEIEGGLAPGRELRLLIVHDHDIVRSGFRLLLGGLSWVQRCIGARNPEEAVVAWNRYEPHVALIDLFVGGTPGTDVCARLRRLRPHGQVLLMSATEQVSHAAATAAGAAGFISSGARAADIAATVRLAAEGKLVTNAVPAASALLSRRQRDVLVLMADGATNTEIAARLQLSAHTVKGHTTEIYRRLNVRNRTEAVRRAHCGGLLA
jgi:DNA-binding NarL/FixJ family response regulator